jgi:hypothetical protein
MISRVVSIRPRPELPIASRPRGDDPADFDDMETVPWERLPPDPAPGPSPSVATLPALRVGWNPQVRVLVN